MSVPVDTRRSPHARWRGLPLEDVSLSGGFWAERQRINRELSLGHGFRMLEEAGNLHNLRLAAGLSTGEYRGPVFMDSDVYKWLEAGEIEGHAVRALYLATGVADLYLGQADSASASVLDVCLDPAAPLDQTWRADLLGGIVTVQASGEAVEVTNWGASTFRPPQPGAVDARHPVPLTAIPYFAWANRQPGPMRVWIPLPRPAPAPPA